LGWFLARALATALCFFKITAFFKQLDFLKKAMCCVSTSGRQKAHLAVARKQTKHKDSLQNG
jgi:hypothetical protein